jgi:hypothetical protein
VISLDWTLAHHERGPKIYAVTKSYDYVERRTALFQTVVTAVVSNREWIDGLEVVVQDPKDLKAEAASAKRRPNRAMNRWLYRHPAYDVCRGRGALVGIVATHASISCRTANGRRSRLYRHPCL